MSVNDDDDGRHAMHGQLSSMVAEARRQEELRRAEQWWALGARFRRLRSDGGVAVAAAGGLVSTSRPRPR
jgi:hypothetical protein